MEKEPQIEAAAPKTVEEAIECFHGDNYEVTINFLRNNRGEIGEFCLQVSDSYNETDRSTPFLRLAMLIDKLL